VLAKKKWRLDGLLSGSSVWAMTDALLTAARAGDQGAFQQLLAPHLRELRAHCYRMSGSLHEADDLLQESLLRAWRGLPGFEGRASLRTWLYQVATSACLSALAQRRHRQLPADLGPPAGPDARLLPDLECPWLEPCPGDFADDAVSPEARYSARESVSLAFLSALQRLPPRQRAVLLLRDVLGWQATECAALLDQSVASVNSALQRARETLDPTRGAAAPPAPEAPSEATRSLLARYVQAWERADLDGLVALLREDAVLSMPPFPAWFQGAAAIRAALGGMVFTGDAAGRYALVETRANGQPAFASYERTAAGLQPVSLHVLTVEGGRIARLEAFLDARLFAKLGLPT
jgi:RNA polymerase sigma-70 factor (ECF subfamily)